MRRSELPYLDDLRAFEAAARLGSIRAAAGELALTHAAISRRVARLAEAVGAPLFEKAGRGLALTPAGLALRDSCRRSFDDLSRTIATIRATAEPQSRAVLLSCERSVAMRWLIPRLSQFQDAHPEVKVHLSVGGGPIQGQGGGELLALRRLDFELGATWQAEPLFPEQMGPVLAPMMLAQFAAGDYVALGSETRPEAWDRWLAAHPQAPRPRERRSMDHHFLMVEAACAGLGVALSPMVLALDDLARERLVAPLGFGPDGSQYGLIQSATGALSPGAQQLARWIRAQCEGLKASGL